MQRDIHHVAVGAVLRHLDPVSDPDHVLGGELDARDQRQDRIPEDQQQDRRHGAEAGQQNDRRLIHQRREDEYGAQDVNRNLGNLHESLDRAVPGDGPGFVNRTPGTEQRTERERDGQRKPGHRDVGNNLSERIAQIGHKGDAEVHHQCRNRVRQPVQHAMLENDVVPLLAGALGHAAQHRDHAALDEQVEQHADKHQYGNAADGVHPVGKAVEPVRQTGVQLVHDIR